MDVNYEYEDDYHGSQDSLYDSLSSVSSIYDYINKLLDDPKKLGDVNEEAHNDFTKNNETVAIILHISYGIILLIGVVVLTYTIRSMSASFRFLFACKITSLLITCLIFLVSEIILHTKNNEKYLAIIDEIGEMAEISANAKPSFNQIGPLIAYASMNVESIFTTLLIFDIYKRVVLLSNEKFSSSKMLGISVFLGGISLVKDASLAAYDLLATSRLIGKESWKSSINTLNALAGSSVAAVLVMYWGVNIVLKIKESQNFQKKANIRKNDKKLSLLKGLVIWLLFSNILKVALSIFKLIKSGAHHDYLICMNDEWDYFEGIKNCEKYKSSFYWHTVTKRPIVNVVLSASDLLAFPLLKICN